MWCQVCGARNPDEVEYCVRCQHKLLVISGALVEEEVSAEQDEGFSFDEHLLERISILEEVLKRTGETVKGVLTALNRQEESILVQHAGMVTLRELLERRGVIKAREWNDLWEARLDEQLLAVERRDRFNRSRERIAALFSGEERQSFLSKLEQAEMAFAAFDGDRALNVLETAFGLDRRNHELALFLGETFFHEGERERALHYLSELLELKPDHYDGLVYSGVARHQRGEWEAAERHLRRAAALFPEDFLANFSLGAMYAASERLSQAVVFLERAIERDALPEALHLLGSCHYEMGHLQRAIRRLDEAIRIDPTFEECYHLLGLCYLDRHWNRKALEAFRQAQRLNPKRMRYEDLVVYLSGQGTPGLPKLTPAAARWTKRAEDCLQRGEHREALRLYRRAIDEDPDNPGLLLAYALACLHGERSQEIKALTRRVIDLEPGEMLKATAYATLIAALRVEGKYREGNRVGESMLAESTSDFGRTIAYYELAYNFAEMEENLDQALELARNSLECSPEELKQFPLAALGWVHYKRNEFQQAIDCLRRSADLGENATTMTHLGMALLASGEQERAKQALDRARSLSRSGGALEDTMMELMRDSARLVERVRRKG